MADPGGPDSPAAHSPRPQTPAALLVPVHPRHEQLQAQRANVEAQEVALLAERERLMQDGHRQRGLEEELRRLQSEHDRYQRPPSQAGSRRAPLGSRRVASSSPSAWGPALPPVPSMASRGPLGGAWQGVEGPLGEHLLPTRQGSDAAGGGVPGARRAAG